MRTNSIKKYLFIPVGATDVFNIQNLICGALRFRFNKQVGYVHPEIQYLNMQSQIVVNNEIVLDTGDRRLFLEKVRLPGTRIQFRRYYSEHFQIFIFSLKDTILLIFDKLSPQLELTELHFIDQIVDPDDHANAPLLAGHVFSADEMIFILPEHWMGSVNNPVSFLSNLIAQERAIHPLNSIVSQDMQWLDRADAYWSAIEFLGYDGAVKKSVLENKNKSLSVLLYEWSVLFPINDEPASRLIKDDYQLIREEAISFWEEASGVDAYSPQIVWNLFGVPLMYRKLQQILADHPENVLVLYFDALKSGHFWHSLLLKQIVSMLSKAEPSFCPMLQIMVLFQTRLRLHVSASEISVIPQQSPEPWSFQNETLRVAMQDKYFRFHALNFNLDILIDKYVRIVLNNQRKTLVLSPLYADDIGIKLHQCLITIDEFQIAIPLVWHSFSLKIRNVRLRFLLKKGRYQLTIKGNSAQKPITIGEESVSFDKQQYHRIYIPVPKQLYDARFQFYDMHGCGVMNLNQGSYYIQALVTDYRGILQESLQAKQQGSKKSKHIDLITEKGLPKIDLKEGIEIYGGRRKVFEVIETKVAPSVALLRQLNADVTPYSINCFLDNLDMQQEIQQTWISFFGFSLPIDDLKNISGSRAIFNLLILNDPPDWPILSTGDYCKFLKPAYKNVHKCILVKPSQFRDWLKKLIVE